MQTKRTKRVSRRETLKGLSALAIGGSALASAGCSSEASEAAAAGGGAASASASAGGAAVAKPSPAGASSGSAVAGRSGTTTAAQASSAGATGTPSSVGAGSSGSAGGAPIAGGQAGIGSAAAGSGTAGAAGNAAAGSAGAAGAAGSVGLDALQCVVTPAMTEGPFFIEEKLQRSNLIMGESADAIVKAVPLQLVIGVFEVSGMMCMPVSGVQVDIWHADALGVYSDVASGVVQSVDTRGKKFLRGFQLTDAQGLVTFETIYPGWYASRTIHIHFKLRMLGSASKAREFTSQMFFDETINAVVLAKAPYSGHPGTRSVLNDGDHIYNGTATNNEKPPAGKTPPGKVIMPTLTAMGAGYTAMLKIGLTT